MKVRAVPHADLVLPDLNAVRSRDSADVAYLAIEGLKYMLQHVSLDIVPRFL
jgi:hypothetical protein